MCCCMEPSLTSRAGGRWTWGFPVLFGKSGARNAVFFCGITTTCVRKGETEPRYSSYTASRVTAKYQLISRYSNLNQPWNVPCPLTSYARCAKYHFTPGKGVVADRHQTQPKAIPPKLPSSSPSCAISCSPALFVERFLNRVRRHEITDAVCTLRHLLYCTFCLRAAFHGANQDRDDIVFDQL